MKQTQRPRPPLSFAQERLWFLEQYLPGSGTYHRPAHMRFKGRLDVRCLQRALDALIARHETLRTSFPDDAGNPYLAVREAFELDLAVTDLADREAPVDAAVELARADVRVGFNIARGPLIRAHLLRLGPEDHLLLLTLHHIVFDGWSEGVLHRDLGVLYRSALTGCPSELPPLPTTYSEYATRQRQFFDQGHGRTGLDRWRQRLTPLPPPLGLPTDYPRPAVQTGAGARFAVLMGAGTVNRVREFALPRGGTFFMGALAAFYLLLYRYSDQWDVIVGVPVAGRTSADVESLVGLFVNTLPVRVAARPSEDFEALFGTVRDCTLEAFAHQDVPFHHLVEALSVERNLSRSPLFDVMFQYRNYPRPVFDAPDLQAMPWPFDGGIEKFDMLLELREAEQGAVQCVFRYSADLFAAQTVQRMAAHYLRLVEEVLAREPRPLIDYSLVSREERERQLFHWNDTRRDYPSGSCLHSLFEQQVERTPNRVAVEHAGQTLTYRELNDRANQLAHRLLAEGARPDALIGICLERSPSMVVAILGTLKAGCGYVPLDPGYPAARLAFLLEDADPLLVITSTPLAERITGVGPALLCIDAAQDWLAASNRGNPVTEVDPRNVAYLVYTSGSTGKPKASAVEHRNAVNLVHWARDTYSDEELRYVLFATALSFDFSILELFVPLCWGGAIVVVENVLDWESVSRADRITLVTTVPSALDALLEAGRLPPGVLTVNVGGEKVENELVRRILAHASVERVLDLYGPSECTSCSLAGERRPDDAYHVGRPIANTQVYILDAERRLMPTGFPGEIYIGGAGLSRGYFRRDDLTADRYVPDTLRGMPGQRLYRTGDRGRYLPDGRVQFLGRFDELVKIRGHRVEPGEIETTLAQHPAVRQSIVLRDADNSGGQQLIAYVLPTDEFLDAPEDPRWVQWQAAQVAEWQTIFDDTFAAAEPPEDRATNVAGVNSSYTGEPVPAEESRDWVEHTARRIGALGPGSILDIGCGLGRILFRLAPSCSRYWGVDFSQSALDYVERHRYLLGDANTDVRLFCTHANDLDALPRETFDVVVINGVSQYFPGVDSLVDAIRGALEFVAPGGCVFVGDVRNFALLDAFHLSVLLHRQPDDLAADALLRRFRQSVATEEELTIAPELFYDLPDALPRVSCARIMLKRGRFLNELTRFRYDALLYTDPRQPAGAAGLRFDWHEHSLSVERVREILDAHGNENVTITRVPNARVSPEQQFASPQAYGDWPPTAREICGLMDSARAEAVDPEAFWQLATAVTRGVNVEWSRSGGSGCFDAVFAARDGDRPERQPLLGAGRGARIRALSRYGNNPLTGKLNQILVPELRRVLQEQLPDFMVPSAIVVLDKLPTTVSGKVDRRALPRPSARAVGTSVERAPSTPTEQLVAAAWAQLFGLDSVELRDNFFELGGNSLIAIRMANIVRDATGTDVPIRRVFEAPILEDFARLTDQI